MERSDIPAFPSLNAEFTGLDSDGFERWDTEPSGGMTLRDYFAAKAMPKAWDDWKEYCKSPEGSNGELIFPGECVENIADDAYLMADAMLEARK